MLTDVELSDIPLRLKALGKSQAWLARSVGIDPSSMTKTIKGDRRLQASELLKIEELLGERIDVRDTAPEAAKARPNAPARIPVYGYAAAGGTDRVALNEGNVIDWIEAPAFWTGQGEIFVIRIIGESMEPRFFSGEPAIVHRNLPPARGQDCVIEFRDGSGLVKNYRGTRDGMVWAMQYNPPPGEASELHFPVSDVKAIHAVHLPTRLMSL